MFNPTYTITPALLETIKQIAVSSHDLNQRVVSELTLAEWQREARAVSTYASTSIEGNPLSLTEVKRLLKEQPAQQSTSAREVLNYNLVLKELSQTPDQPLHKTALLRIHKGVMQGLLPAHQAGRYRLEPIVVRDPRTPQILYLPPDHQDVPALMADLLTFVQANRTTLDPVLLAGLFHKQFVIIHPFMDGNGRTTRLGTHVLLAGLGLNLFPLFSFETYYNQNVSRYFQFVGVRGDYNDLADKVDFTPWLEYFAEGILDELHRVGKQLQQVQATPDTTLKPYHQAILAHIDQHGFITDADYARLTHRAKATRNLDFNKLIALGLIRREGRGRAIHYRRP